MPFRSFTFARLLFAAICLCASTAFADNLSGQASIIDDDTLEIHGTRIRLWGIDAPESNQLCRGRTSVNAPCVAAKGDEIVTSGSRSDRGKLGRGAMRQARRLDPRTVYYKHLTLPTNREV